MTDGRRTTGGEVLVSQGLQELRKIDSAEVGRICPTALGGRSLGW